MIMNTHPKNINKVAILGSGVMGGQIAAVFANAHIPVRLYGFKDHVDVEFQHIAQLKPAAYTHPDNAKFISTHGYEEDFALLADCDLVIEAIVEKLDAKLDMFANILPHLHATAILASNTSSLSIEKMAQALPSINNRFLGVHFFNPPRYLPLVELIPAQTTDADVVETLEFFLTSEIGKNIIQAQDNTGFVANRIGVFAMATALRRHLTTD